MGIAKVRLTDGEPLVRKNTDHLVAKVTAIKGINELCMTTNGSLITQMAAKLKRSGLGRVSISIDSLDEVRYSLITRGGNLRQQQAPAGVGAAIKAELTPIKINMVILEDTIEQDIEMMKAFYEQRDLRLQKIMLFSLYDKADLSRCFHTERPPKCSRCSWMSYNLRHAQI